jgi:hypothetical protein
MSALDELIETANKLCTSLERVAENEKIYSTNVCLELERYSWEIYRMMNDIKEIREYMNGGV